ncbi:MAG: hypothetical protein DME65_02940 [Verrucomicrobia bacterium]|nr:MAG: hypothetical protein DME65_02940 [Verrucomicrobiota bacterium]
MEVRQCDVCRSWRQADLFPDGNKREDGTARADGFVCFVCQREIREMREMERALDHYEKVRRGMHRQIRRLPAGSHN